MTTSGRRYPDAAVPGLVLAALVPMGVLHGTASATVHPVSQPISDYVVAPGGYALLAGSTLALAGAGLVLARRMRAAGLPRPAVALLASWSGALVLVGAFPTNAPGAPPDVVAAVHRYAGAWALVALPLACLLVARRARRLPRWTASAPQLARWSVAVAVLGGVFLLCHAPTVLLGAPGFPALGAVQRVLYGAVLVLVGAAGRAVRAVAAGHAAPAGHRIGEPVAALGGAA